jgi:SAM-dependent methyltransferase
MNAIVSNRSLKGDFHQTRADPHSYPLGYSDAEFKRLELQGAFLYDLTEDVLRRAGIAPGMRVLDIGCGVGDMSMLAGAMVGPSGEVFGIDRSEEAIDVARRRAAACGQSWLRFEAAEIEAFSGIRSFDAVIGRLVLMYLPDPAATLRRLRGHLRSGGIVAFHEMAMPLARSVPDGPQFRECSRWIMETFARAGLEFDMGSRLFATFLAAGLPAPQMIVAGRAEGGPYPPVYDYIARVLRTLLPVMERTGVASAAEVGVETMADRLRQEAVERSACIMPPPLIGAWSRIPG